MSRSHLTGFGLSMTVKAIKLEEIRVFRRLAPTIGFLAGLAPATVAPMAHAQVNIDQGMPPAQIFANDCATCHKSVRGLAVGKNSLMLTGFLREHYTASNEQAAALAAYVLGAGGSEPAPQEPKRKPESEHAKATGEEPKTGEAKTGEAKIEEPKTAAHPQRGVGEARRRGARECQVATVYGRRNQARGTSKSGGCGQTRSTAGNGRSPSEKQRR